jgi:hypothetical protein
MANKSKPLTWQMIADRIWALSVDESTLVECSLEQAYRAVEYQRTRNPDCQRRFRFKAVDDGVRVTRREDRPVYNLDDWALGETRSFVGHNMDRWQLLKKLNADFRAGKRNAMCFETAVYGVNHFCLARVK